MSGTSLIYMCYWGGDDEHPFDGPHFLKGPKCAITAHCRWRYNQLIDELYRLMDVDRMKYELEVICRYPHSFDSGIGEYFPFRIKDDADMDIMFDVSVKFGGLSNLQLYVVMKLIENQRYKEVEARTRDIVYENSPSSYRDAQIGPSTQTLVSTQTSNYDNRACTNDQDRNENSEDSEDYEEEEETDVDAELDNVDDGYEERNSDSDIDLREGDDGPIDDGVETNLVHYEASENQRYERGDYAFYSDIGDVARQDGGLIDFHDQQTFPVWDPKKDEIAKGIRFSTKSEAQFEIKRYHINSNRRFKVIKSTPNTWKIECLLKNFPCEFYVRVSRKKPGYWQVTQYKSPHCCLYSGESQDHPNLDAKFIGRQIVSLIKKDPDVKIGVIIAHVNEVYDKTITYKKAWCGKQKGIAEVFGDWEESYKRLPRVLAAIQKYNRGTIVEYTFLGDPPLPIGPDLTFQRVFWAFGPCIEAFSHCRPVISVDGTFLHGRYKGVILIAMGVDAQDSILPIAFAIVEKEDHQNWRWFLYLVCRHIIKDREVCLISDRHWGILKTISEDTWWPNVHHRYCLRHVRANFLEKHGGSDLKYLFWKAGKASQDRKLKFTLETIRLVKPEAIAWIVNLDPRKWTLAHDGGYRYGIMTTNMSEVFNGVMKGARGMPITAIVETAFYRCVEYFQVRHGFSRNALGGNLDDTSINPLQQFSQKIHYRFRKNSDKATKHFVRRFNVHEMGVYQVTTACRGEKGGNIQIVRFNERTCSCGKWVAYHMPCSHLLACCQAQNIDGRNFVDLFFTLSKYYKTWKGTFEPIPHEAYWNVDHLVPTFKPNPLLRRAAKSGRPKSRRFRNCMDFQADKRKTQCSICKQEGHNRRRCPNNRP